MWMFSNKKKETKIKPRDITILINRLKIGINNNKEQQGKPTTISELNKLIRR